MRDQTLAKAKDIAVIAGAVVAVSGGILGAINHMLDAKLDAKFEPVYAELASIRAEMKAMDERNERRFLRLEGLHLVPAPAAAAEDDT